MRKTVSGPGWGATSNPVPGDIEACLDELNIDYRVAGDEATGLCPHPDHTDRHPSWSVNLDSGAHNCFSCGFSGSFVGLVETVLDVDRISAVTWVRRRGGIERARKVLSGPKKVDTAKKISDARLALFTVPPISMCSDRLITQESCESLGILWDPERDMWIFPIRDPETEKLWGWQEKNERHFRNIPLDVKKSRTLFGLDAFPGGRAILVESPLDVARLLSVGLRGGLATFGAKVSDAQLDLLVERADEVVWALDNDEAGNKSSEKIRRTFKRVPSRFFNYEVAAGAKDIGDWKKGMNANAIKHGVRTATKAAFTRFYV